MKGVTVVSEGQRINLRVYRRYFYPITQTHEGEEYTVYSDTRREREIRYDKLDDYGLDDPFAQIRLIKLARALGAIDCTQDKEGVNHCRVTICRNREMFNSDSDDVSYTPFVLENLEGVAEMIQREKQKIEWRRRMASS